MKKGAKIRLILYGTVLLIFLVLIVSFTYIQTMPDNKQEKGVLSNLKNLFSFGKGKTFSIQENLCPQNPNYISPQDIIPRPQNIEMLDCNNPVVIDDTWKIYTDLNNNQDNFTAYYLNNQTLEKTNNQINLNINDISNLSSNKRIIIGNPNANPTLQQIAQTNNININLEKGFNQGYILSVQPNQILIFSNSSQGSFYGAVSLIWLLQQSGQSINLPNVKITDWPDFNIRGFFGQRDYNYTTEEWIENLTSYKFNMWLQGSSHIYNVSTQATIDRSLGYKEMFSDRHFLSTAMLQPSTVVYFNPNFYQGTYAYNISMEFNDSDDAVSTEEEFVLNNSGFEKDEDNNNYPDYWKHQNTQWPGNWTWDCTESHSGQCSIKFNLSVNLGKGESSSFLYLSDNSSTNSKFPILEPNEYYVLSFRAKKIGNENNKHQPQITVTARNTEINDQYTKSAIIRDTSTWDKYYIHFYTTSDYTRLSLWSRAYWTNNLTLWLDDFQIVKLSDKLRNVLRTDDTRLHVFNEDRTIEYIKNVDYYLNETGKIKITNLFEGKQTIIKRISSGNIPENAEIKVDYDFAAYLSKSLWPSLSEPAGFPAYENWLVKPTMEAFKPDLVFINIDEMAGINKDSRDLKQGLKNYQLIAEYIEKVVNIIRKYDPDVKIMTWADMQSPFHNGEIEYIFLYGGPKGKSWYSLDFIDRDIIQIPWWYHDREFRKTIAMSPVLFNKYGFDFIGGPGTYVPFNDANNTIRHIKWWSYVSYINNAIGLMPHSFFQGFEGYGPGANYTWNAFKEQIGCDPEFIEICDGIDNDCDNLYPAGRYTDYIWPSNIDEGFNLTDDPFNCGECHNFCYYPKAYSSCNNSTCQFDGCYEYFYDANNNLEDGCECNITNNGTEICDSLDNDCNGQIDESVCPSGGDDDSGNGGGRGGGGGPPPIINQTPPSNQTNQTTPFNQTNQTILSNQTNQTEIPKPPVISGRFRKFLKKYWIQIIIIIIFIIISITALNLTSKIKQNYKTKKKIKILRKNEDKIKKARQFVEKLKQKGHSSDSIKKVFLENGWPEYLADLLIQDTNPTKI